jgi:hypothetical protein
MTWLAHAGPAASGAEAAGRGVVLAGRGAAPARSPSRINGVLTAVRGMVVHAVAVGQAPAVWCRCFTKSLTTVIFPWPRGERTAAWRGGCGPGIVCVNRKRPSMSAGSHGLCRAHRSGQLRCGVSVEEVVAAPARHALPRFATCRVAGCPRDRSGCVVAYCEPHQTRWIREHRATPGLDEAQWRLITSPIVVTGQVSLAGMQPPLITVQVLYGLQVRTRMGAHTRPHVLRVAVEDLRRAQANAIDTAAEGPLGSMGRKKRGVLGVLARHVALAVADPETERVKDVWELAVFGLRGRLTFTAISQPWLREATKRWAADELPRHRGNGAGRVMRALCRQRGAPLAKPAGRPKDHGNHPAALARKDIESFLHRFTYLASVGKCSAELRVRTCQDVKRILGRIRALGLTRPAVQPPGWVRTSPSPPATFPPNPNAVNPTETCPQPSCGNYASRWRCWTTGSHPAARSG